MTIRFSARLRVARWAVAAAMCAWACAPDTARAAIPAGPDAPTQKQFFAREVAFDRRTSVEGYIAHGSKNPKWDADAARFLTDTWDWANSQPGARPLEDLRRDGKALEQKGCDDPMVRYAYGRVLLAMNRSDEAMDAIRQAADELAGRGYAAAWRGSAAGLASRLAAQRRDDSARLKYAGLALEAMKAMFTGHDYGKDERSLFVSHVQTLNDALSTSMKRSAWQSVKDLPGADPVAVLLIEGEYHIGAAWEARGGGYANTVTPEGWKGFSDHLEKARAALTKAWELDKTIPEPSAAMIPVAMGASGPEEMRTWFDRTVAARLDYPKAYSTYIFGLYPRWHGDRGSLMLFANECFDTKRFDTAVPMEYLNILLVVRDECDGGDTSAWAEAEVYDRAKELFEKSLAPGGAFAGDRHYRSVEAAFAIRAGRWEDARQAIEALGKHTLAATGTRVAGLTPLEVRGRAFAYSGPIGAETLKARALAIAGKRKEALAGYEAALAKQTNPDAATFLRGAVQVLHWEQDFQDGKAVALKADKDMAGFRPLVGRWELNADGNVVGKAAGAQQLNMVCTADFGNQWELKADVDFVHAGADWTESGITLSAPGSSDYFSFTLNTKNGKFIVRSGTYQEVRSVAAAVKKHNQMIVRRDGGQLFVHVNGEQVFTGEAPPDEEGRSLRIGFGGWPVRPDSDIIEFSNVVVKPFHNGL